MILKGLLFSKKKVQTQQDVDVCYSKLVYIHTVDNGYARVWGADLGRYILREWTPTNLSQLDAVETKPKRVGLGNGLSNH